MSSFLLLPVVLFLGLPFGLGAFIAATHLFRFLKTRTKTATAFTVTLCIIAGITSLLTAPAFVIGTTGYIIAAATYIVFVAIGAPKLFRLGKFLSRELDGDKTNDVDLGDGAAAKDQTPPTK